MDVDTGWVRPPRPIGGLDHLGVQAPCIAIYGGLLPGLTNVTDRARYFSFYPWLLTEYERRYSDKSRASLCRVVRRAECLVCLVASWHEHTTGEAPELHGRATVGRQTLHGVAGDIVDGARVDLDDYATLEPGGSRYFKNPLGGLAQYYYGALRDLSIVDWIGDTSSGLVGYDHRHAPALAEAFGAGVDSDQFFSVLESQSVGSEELESILPFCPCGLKSNPRERQCLEQLFLGHTEPWNDDSGGVRRRTLELLLDIVRVGAFAADLDLEGHLRACSYSGHQADGTRWEPSQRASGARRAWAAYQRNELLSVALQGLFWATLRAVIDERSGRFPNVETFGDIAWTLVAEEVGSWQVETVAQAATQLQSTLPPLSAFTDEAHEVQRALAIRALGASRRPSSEDTTSAAVQSITVLAALLARGLEEYPYADVDLDPSYFGDDDPHLLSLTRAQEEWGDWPLERWIRWLATRWGLERHLHVALRKLRAQGQDTFRVRPLDAGYVVVDAPAPVFTAPRLTQATQVLRDLGLIEQLDDGWELTAAGHAAWEATGG